MDVTHLLLAFFGIVLAVMVLPSLAVSLTRLRDALVGVCHSLMDEAEAFVASFKRPAKPAVTVSPGIDPVGLDTEPDANYVAFKCALKRGDRVAGLRSLQTLAALLPPAAPATGGQS